MESQLLGIDSKQIPGEDAMWGAWRFPQLSDDLDVNRTMNLV